MNKEAMYYHYEEDNIRCDLCPHKCFLQDGKIGICGVRIAKYDDEKLKLYTLNYGEITSIAVDPIEKKPLYNFYPGTNILSVGSFGCNFNCSFCQNYSISQYKAESRFMSVEELADTSLNFEDSIGIAFTYNEPSIWYEYVLDVAKEIKKKNPSHKVVLVTNGYISEEPLKELLPYIDAMNIDLKGNKEYYKKLCFGELDYVKNTIKLAYKHGCHIEITTLLVPGENTDEETIKDIAEFISSLDRKIPIHITKYFPRYKMKKEATPIDEIKSAYKIFNTYLDNVYLGNLSYEESEYCRE